MFYADILQVADKKKNQLFFAGNMEDKRIENIVLGDKTFLLHWSEGRMGE